MSFEAESELTQIESTMLNIVKDKLREFADDNKEGEPIPMTLIQAFDKVHSAILKHVAKGSSMDMNAIMKNPRAWLLQNDRMRAQVLKLIEQRELAAQHQPGAPPPLRVLPGAT